MPKRLLIFLSVIVSFAAKPDTAAKISTPAVVKVQVKHVPLTLRYDSTAPVIRKLNRQAIAAYAKDKDFAYIEKPKPKPSLWERFWKWFWNLFRVSPQPAAAPQKLPGGSGLSILFQVMKYAGLMAGIAALVYIVIKIAGADIRKLFKRTPQKASLPYSEIIEDINEIAFDDELDNAIASRNYKLAVRLLYLRSLKQLNDAGLIRWQKDKTNAVYVGELTNDVQRIPFGTLTRQFEYIWYGNFPVNGQLYQDISAEFNNFKLLLP